MSEYIKKNFCLWLGLLLLAGVFVINPGVIEKTLRLTGMLDKEQVGHIHQLRAVLFSLGLCLVCLRVIPANWRLLLVSVLLSLATAETVLRLNPLLLGDDFVTTALSRYRTNLTGICVYDPQVKMNFMKPNYRTMMYAHGRRWVHETDRLGFRNAETRQDADIVLLGDSMIYGHGVNHEQTIGYFLEQKTDYSVVNLARQGDCAFQEAYILNQYGLKFRPRYVLCFFSWNDPWDLNAYLSEDEMRAFVETPIEKLAFGPRGNVRQEAVKIPHFIADFLDYGFYLGKALHFVNFLIEGKASPDRFGKREHPIEYYVEDPTLLEWEYTRKAILQMKRVSELNSSTFVLIPLPSLSRMRYIDILRDWAGQNRIPFIDARSIGRVDAFFLKDGHFSEAGAREMARIITAWIEGQTGGRGRER